MSARLIFCKNCGNRLRIYKKRNKNEYYFRCRTCRLNFDLSEKVVIARATTRKISRKKRKLFKNLPKIQHEKNSISVREKRDKDQRE
jgi:DNA-directed RNA polymerase subunit M/transcription elongation factor TFIIS